MVGKPLTMAGKVVRSLHSQGRNRIQARPPGADHRSCAERRGRIPGKGAVACLRPPGPLRHPRCLDGRGLCLAQPPGASGQGRAVRRPGGQYRGAGGGQGAGPARRVGCRTRGNSTECARLCSLLKPNCWTGDPFRHRRMRTQWQGGRSHATNRIVADSGSCTSKVWQGRAWVCLQDLARSQRIIIPLKGTHLPSGTLRIIPRDSGRVAIHHAVDEGMACSTRACGPETLGVDKGCTEACTDSDGECHGEGPGDLLSSESDQVKAKGRKRDLTARPRSQVP